MGKKISILALVILLTPLGFSQYKSFEAQAIRQGEDYSETRKALIQEAKVSITQQVAKVILPLEKWKQIPPESWSNIAVALEEAFVSQQVREMSETELGYVLTYKVNVSFPIARKKLEGYNNSKSNAHGGTVSSYDVLSLIKFYDFQAEISNVWWVPQQTTRQTGTLVKVKEGVISKLKEIFEKNQMRFVTALTPLPQNLTDSLTLSQMGEISKAARCSFVLLGDIKLLAVNNVLNTKVVEVNIDVLYATKPRLLTRISFKKEVTIDFTNRLSAVTFDKVLERISYKVFVATRRAIQSNMSSSKVNLWVKGTVDMLMLAELEDVLKKNFPNINSVFEKKFSQEKILYELSYSGSQEHLVQALKALSLKKASLLIKWVKKNTIFITLNSR